MNLLLLLIFISSASSFLFSQFPTIILFIRPSPCFCVPIPSILTCIDLLLRLLLGFALESLNALYYDAAQSYPFTESEQAHACPGSDSKDFESEIP